MICDFESNTNLSLAFNFATLLSLVFDIFIASLIDENQGIVTCSLPRFSLFWDKIL